MSDQKISSAETPQMMAVSPGQRLAELTIALGEMQQQLGCVLRYGPQAQHPDAKANTSEKIVFGFLRSMQVLKMCIARVEADIVGSGNIAKEEGKS